MTDDRPVKKQSPEQDAGLFVAPKPTISGASVKPEDLDIAICEKSFDLYRWMGENADFAGRPTVDHSKLLQLIADYEDQAAKAMGMADKLRALIDEPVKAQPKMTVAAAKSLIARLHPTSALATAITVLAEVGKPMHISDLVKEVSKRKGMDVPRASLESTLGTAIKDRKHGVMRPDPGMYEVRV